MNEDVASHAMAQKGLQLIEEAIIRLLEHNPQGLGNAQIANTLGLRSDFLGGHRNYLTYSVLGLLLDNGKVVRDEESKVFIKPQPSPGQEKQRPSMPEKWEAIDIATVGKAMYEEVRGELEATQKGKVVVIDVLSGDYEIGDNDLDATLRMFERRPNALTWGERVGYPAMYYIKERISFR